MAFIRATAILLVATIAWLGGAMAPGIAQTIDDRDAAAIRDVISQQLEAFQRDDGAAAFGFASPGIQQLFRTPENFMGMVRDGYRPVYRPREVEFRELGVSPLGQPTQDVFVIGPDGKPAIARYTMQRLPDGSWRIDGCHLLDAPDQMV